MSEHSITFVVPVYNESGRIDNFFDKLKIYFQKTKNKVEIIIVNDGSTDNTLEKIKNKINNISLFKSKITIINIEKNMGKGHALKKGVERVGANWFITMDVDLAVPLIEVDNFFNKMKLEKVKVFFGSRGLIQSNVKTNIIRKVLGITFSNFVNFFLNLNIKDTQCGFKIYETDLGKKIFSKISDYTYTHDIQIALICKYNNILIKEFPVEWSHQKGSKVNLFIDSSKMFIKLIYYVFSNKKSIKISE